MNDFCLFGYFYVLVDIARCPLINWRVPTSPNTAVVYIIIHLKSNIKGIYKVFRQYIIIVCLSKFKLKTLISLRQNYKDYNF